MVRSGWIDPVFIRNDFPKLETDITYRNKSILNSIFRLLHPFDYRTDQLVLNVSLRVRVSLFHDKTHCERFRAYLTLCCIFKRYVILLIIKDSYTELNNHYWTRTVTNTHFSLTHAHCSSLLHCIVVTSTNR